MAFLLLHNYTDFIKMTRSIPQSGDRIDDNYEPNAIQNSYVNN